MDITSSVVLVGREAYGYLDRRASMGHGCTGKKGGTMSIEEISLFTQEDMEQVSQSVQAMHARFISIPEIHHLFMYGTCEPSDMRESSAIGLSIVFQPLLEKIAQKKREYSR
jgi:hypothetical protein